MDENTKISLKNALWLVGIVIAGFLGWQKMEQSSSDRIKANEDRQAALESRVAALETLNAAKEKEDNSMAEIARQNNEMLSALLNRNGR